MASQDEVDRRGVKRHHQRCIFFPRHAKYARYAFVFKTLYEQFCRVQRLFPPTHEKKILRKFNATYGYAPYPR